MYSTRTLAVFALSPFVFITVALQGLPISTSAGNVVVDSEDVFPIDGNIVTMDTTKDFWILWNEDGCHYVEDYYYLFAFGCPTEQLLQGETNPREGFWNPCTRPSCRLTFYRNETILTAKPNLINIRSFVTGGAAINVTAMSNPLNEDCINDCEFVGTISSTNSSEWKEEEFKMNNLNPNYKYVRIELISNTGLVLLDKITFELPYAITTTTEPDNSDAENLHKVGFTFTLGFLFASIHLGHILLG